MFRALSRKLVIFNFRGRIHSVSRMLYRILDIRSGVECIFGIGLPGLDSNMRTTPHFSCFITTIVILPWSWWAKSCARHESAYFVMAWDSKFVGGRIEIRNNQIGLWVHVYSKTDREVRGFYSGPYKVVEAYWHNGDVVIKLDYGPVYTYPQSNTTVVSR